MTMQIKGLNIVCDSCGVSGDKTALKPWAQGETRRICPDCFQKEFGITIEEHIKKEDEEALKTLAAAFGTKENSDVKL